MSRYQIGKEVPVTGYHLWGHAGLGTVN